MSFWRTSLVKYALTYKIWNMHAKYKDCVSYDSNNMAMVKVFATDGQAKNDLIPFISTCWLYDMELENYLAMDRSKRCKNCRSDVWYMQFTMLISTIRKYRMLPRVATGRNSSRAVVIFTSVSAATCSFWLTSWAVALVMFNTLIRSSSSTKEPWKVMEQSD